MRPCLLMLFVAGALTAADRPSKVDSKKDSALKGKWSVDKAFTGADAAPDVETYSVEIGANNLTMTVDNQPHEAAIKVDSSKKTIDMIPADGRFKGKTLLGLYALEEDRLTFYFAEPDRPRPTQIPQQGRTGHFLLALKKMKKKPK